MRVSSLSPPYTPYLWDESTLSTGVLTIHLYGPKIPGDVSTTLADKT